VGTAAGDNNYRSIAARPALSSSGQCHAVRVRAKLNTIKNRSAATCPTSVPVKRTVASYGWEGNRGQGVALAMRHRLRWFVHPYGLEVEGTG